MENLIDELASTINIFNEGTQVIAAAQINKKYENLLTEFNSIPSIINKISDETIEVKWLQGDAIYLVEYLWDKIQIKQRITKTFAQQYGQALNLLRMSYSTLKVQKIFPEAIIPKKAHPLDSGFDVSIIRVINPNFGPGVVLYGTGLIVRPPDGYYIDLVLRSSVSKLGWGFANSVGIIDSQYRGELCITMFKLNENAKEIELPARIGQMILRPLICTDVEVLDDVGKTKRGENGWGSSGK